MDARQLRTFLKIVELGSITRAADALGVAQPSLSQLLLRLEDEVGMKLFRRTARGVTTTEGGRVFEEHARHILRTIDQALEDVRQLKDEAGGRVSFAMPMSVSLVVGVTLVKAALKHAPRVSLRLIEAFSGYIRTWLDEGSIDLGILYDVGPLRHLSVKRLAREELYLVGPAGRFGALDTAAPVSSHELGELPLILPSPQHGMRQFLDREVATVIRFFRCPPCARIWRQGGLVLHASRTAPSAEHCAWFAIPAQWSRGLRCALKTWSSRSCAS